MTVRRQGEHASLPAHATPDEIDGGSRLGFPTPSRKLECFSSTLEAWKWAEQAVPGYIRSHVHWSNLDRARGEMVLLDEGAYRIEP